VSEEFSTGPLSPYGKHKLMAEEICKEYFTHFSVKTCSLRIFSAYGPGLKKQILWDIYQKSLKGNVISLFGTGNETRDFVYIDDIVRGIETVLMSGNFEAGVYNVGSGKEISILELTDILTKEMGYKGKFAFSGNERMGDPICWKADISLIRKLGFEPQTSIKTGAGKYIQWLREEKLL
jgi:dTDP-glucose 4,6-dehydratase/UDP-glucose 4-epimerase